MVSLKTILASIRRINFKLNFDIKTSGRHFVEDLQQVHTGPWTLLRIMCPENMWQKDVIIMRTKSCTKAVTEERSDNGNGATVWLVLLDLTYSCNHCC